MPAGRIIEGEDELTRVIPRVTGYAFAAAIATIGTVRGPRPIHTPGVRLQGVVRWLPGSSRESGVAWIDDRGADDLPVVGRFSRGAGLPASLPDVLGLALRLGNDEGDLLLSTTGIGVPGRFLLQPRMTPTRALFGTLMPYRGRTGPVLVAARTTTPGRMPAQMETLRRSIAATPWRLELMWATPRSRWHRFGQLELTSPTGPADTSALRFDPVLRPPRGAHTYDWTRALREPSYSRARGVTAA